MLYLGQNTSRSSFRPCEAAFLARPSPQFQDQFVTPSVNVLVSPSNVANLKKAYSQIPGVKVQPLRFLPKHLTVSSILAMMSVDQSQSSSLYMAQVVKILRDTAAEATGDFDFEDFKSRLAQFPFTDMQRRPLDQRLELLGSFLNLGNTPSCFDFQSGSMTIVDLSCPFVDANTACVLFNICMGIYLEDSSPEVGRVIAVDEAHKVYLHFITQSTCTPNCHKLSLTLFSVPIRQFPSIESPHRETTWCNTSTTARWRSNNHFHARANNIATAD